MGVRVAVGAGRPRIERLAASGLMPVFPETMGWPQDIRCADNSPLTEPEPPSRQAHDQLE